jgi:hypothetical protein
VLNRLCTVHSTKFIEIAGEPMIAIKVRHGSSNIYWILEARPEQEVVYLK